MISLPYHRVFYHNTADRIYGKWAWVPGPETIYAKITPDQGNGSFHVPEGAYPPPSWGDTVVWGDVTLPTGQYTLRVMYSKNRPHGIAEMRFGDMELMRQDEYSATNQVNLEYIRTFEIKDVAQTADLIWVVVEKNAESSGYIAAFSLIEIFSGDATTPGILPGITLPQQPNLNTCAFPDLTWNFIDVIAGLAKWLGCTLRNILEQVTWIVSTLAALIPQLLAAIAYFLSLKWITDLIQAFFTQLDIWISTRLEVDPDKPLLDEILKRLVDWIFAPLNDAAKRRREERKW